MSDKFKFALNKYLAAIKEDYIQWGKPEAHLTATERSVRAMSRERFCNSLLYQEGKKYIKVLEQDFSDPTALMDRVHSFIVKENSDKFKAGDILMASSYDRPNVKGKNPARGNIFEEYQVKWTGALYADEMEKFLKQKSWKYPKAESLA